MSGDFNMTLNCTYVLPKFKVASIVEDKGRMEERVRRASRGKHLHQKEELYLS